MKSKLLISALSIFILCTASVGVYVGAGSSITKLLYHLEGNSTDASGNANNGTDTNVTYNLTTGKFKQGASFNGSSSRIVAGSMTSGLAGTVSLWFKRQGTITVDQYFFHMDNGNGTYILLNDDAVVVKIDDNTIWSAVSCLPQDITKWHYLTLTWDNSQGSNKEKLYIDGNLKITANVSLTSSSYTNITIGANTGLTAFYNGFMDEFIWENVAWSDAKVKKYYSWSIGRFNN